MLRIITSICILVVLNLAPQAHAQQIIELHNIQLGDSPEHTRSMLESHSESVKHIEKESITLPLAIQTQSHQEYTKLKSSEGQLIQSLILHFADHQLVMIQAQGNAIEALVDQDSTQSTIGEWGIYEQMKIVTNLESDTVWFLNDDGIHAHLFLWDYTHPIDHDQIDASLPKLLKFGSSYRSLAKKLKAVSTSTTKETIDPPTLPTQPKRQTQLNCFGFEYMGVPRKLEAVFADNKLAMVWILTAKQEEDRIRQALIQSFGQPIFVSDTIEAFDDWNIALRKDKPEILAISDDLIPYMKSFFAG